MNTEKEKGESGTELIGQLVDFLLLREYEPGERVPSERELALRFGVGRGNIREALSYLEALRIVMRRAKSGIFMNDAPASVEALAFFAQLGKPLDAKEVRDTVEMRRVHELAAIALACERASAKDLEGLRAILKRSEEKIARGEPINEEDRDFHLGLVNATQNGVFYRIVQVFYLMTEERRRIYFENPRRCRESHEEHIRILNAVSKRNKAAAVKLIEQHLQGVDSYWKDLIEVKSLPAKRAR